MKHLRLFLFLIILSMGAIVTVYAQAEPPARDVAEQREAGARRPNLLAELGLSPDQVQQIRRLNQARRPAMAEAQRRMREANRNLDIAIYGDAVSDADFQSRLKEFHAAQAEVARLRFEGELAVRKVLTPEQLVRFREIRRSFAESQNDNRQRRMQRRNRRFPATQDAPLRRPVND